MNDSLIILDIEHFGPIEKVRIVFDKYTVLIGRQGSGKKYDSQTIFHVYMDGKGPCPSYYHG